MPKTVYNSICNLFQTIPTISYEKLLEKFYKTVYGLFYLNSILIQLLLNIFLFPIFYLFILVIYEPQFKF